MSFSSGDYAHSTQYSAFYSVQAADWGVLSPPSGVQGVMPTAVGAGASGSAYVMTNSRFKPQWAVSYVCPSGTVNPAGVTVASVECIGPIWVASTTITVGLGVAPADNSFAFINGCLFLCTTAGTTGTAAPVWNFARGLTTTDGTVTWTSQGNRGLLRVVFVNASSGNAAPALQAMDFFQS
jgi:hypothetical protein